MKEAQNIEWKQSWRDEYLRWICGFANAEGGMLVIGKNDSGEVVGVDNAAKLLVDIPNKVRDILGIVVAVNLHTQAGRDWLEIVVDAYPSPISYKGEYHLRSGSTKQELRGAALDRFLLRKLGRHWDGVPVPHVAMTDLAPRAMQEAGVARDSIYLTNAVKHFKWEPRGKRRLHKTPAQREIAACHEWLEQELASVKPQVIVALGSTALKSILQDGTATMTPLIGTPVQLDGRWVVTVYHPSYVLRAPDEENKRQAYRVIVEGLRQALRLIDGTGPVVPA